MSEPRSDCRYYNKGTCSKQSRVYCVELGMCGAYDKTVHRPTNPCYGSGGGGCKKAYAGCEDDCQELESYQRQKAEYEKFQKADFQIGCYVCETGKALVKKKNDA